MRNWTDEQKKEWGEKMRLARANKRVEKVTDKSDDTAEVAELKRQIAELTKPSEELTKEQQIVNAYQTGRQSIQTVARVFDVSVDHVLNLIGEGNLASVRLDGDMIDQTEAGRDVEMNYGKDVSVPFSTN